MDKYMWKREENQVCQEERFRNIQRDDKARNYGTRETETETEREEKVGERQQEKRERDQVGSQVTQRQASEGAGGFALLPGWGALAPATAQFLEFWKLS